MDTSSSTETKRSSGPLASKGEQQDEEVVAECFIYKLTSNSDLVVRRKLKLFKEKFMTYHDYDKDPRNKKSWYLDRKCTLEPASEADLAEPCQKSVRPSGTWTISATLGLEKVPSVLLYMFDVVWPTSWAAKGYTTFTFGFENLVDAKEWHAHLSNCILELRNKVTPRKSKSHNLSTPSTSQNLEAAADGIQMSTTPAEAAAARDETMSVLTVADDPGKFYDADQQEDFRDFEDTDSDTEPAPRPRRRYSDYAERWVPYKQINGVSVYHHNVSQDGEDGSAGFAGEYMVSAVIRGTPREVVDVLIGGSSNTTLLGPASQVQVLHCSYEEDNGTKIDKEVLRFVLEAPGLAGAVCAPREMLVERVLKEDEGGLYVVMFTSLDQAPTCTGGSGDYALRVSQQVGQVKGRQTRRLFSKPVRATVRGGYTIAPLDNHGLLDSPESLITCITKVDLGGVCGDRSWFRPMADAMGWTDAFLERILMTVILVRDEVEYSRFAIQPFHMLSTASLDTRVKRDDSKLVDATKRTATAILSARPTDIVPPPNAIPAVTGNFATRLRSTTLASTSSIPRSFQRAIDAIPESDEAEESLGEPIEFDLARSKELSSCQSSMWTEIHTANTAAPFVVRGPTYLKDHKKIPAGQAMFVFGAMDVIEVPYPVEHVARFLPSIRESGAPFAVIINLVIPGNPLLGIVATFMCEHHPDQLGEPPKHPMEEEHDWQPFDFVLHKFWNGDTQTRNRMLKLIPHIAEGSWMIRSSVGTTPVILGKALKTTYHIPPTRQYIEIDIDITANKIANYVTGLVRNATKSLVIDMGFVLEGTAPWELPEVLLGAIRLPNLDIKTARKIDITQEVPLRPPMSYQGAASRVNSMNAPAESQ